MKLVFATRPSVLARRQTGWVMEKLQHAWPDLTCDELVIATQGDRDISRPLPEIGGKGVFTLELENALIEGRAHAAVHSLKDLPVETPAGLMIGAVTTREDARDVMVSSRYQSLEMLPPGSMIGTSSLRRTAQILALRPDLRCEPLRGNVDTRLQKALSGQYDATILAGAGLVRLDLTHVVTEWLSLEMMLPAPGQGALAVQCRTDDPKTHLRLAVLEDPPTHRCTNAERSFLAALEAGCSLPVAAHATFDGALVLLNGLIASTDGTQIIRVAGYGQNSERLGARLANEALANGAMELMKQWKTSKRIPD